MVRSLHLLCLASHAAATSLDKVLLPEWKYGSIGGRCLDGSMAGYYYGPPSSGESSLWVFFMQGGGACTDEASCTQRAKGKMGSSNNWSDTSTGGNIIMSNNTKTNPDFHDAHHVYVPYCTGDVHSGQVVEPTAEQWGLFFSGHVNFENILRHILDTQPSTQRMQRVLLSGSSAGGQGTFNNCDFLQSFLADAGSKAEVSCAPFAGWFFPGFTDDHEDPIAPPSSWPDWSTGQVTPFDSSTTALWQTHLPKECVSGLAPTGEAYKCGSAQAIYPYMQAPVYIVQNWFDTNQLRAQLGLPTNLDGTTESQEYIAYFGRAMGKSKDLVTQHPYGKKGDGLFLPSCFAHGIGDNVRVQGHNSFEGLADWFFGRGQIPAILVDDCAQSAPGLPCNDMCPNVPSPSPSPPSPSPSTDACSTEFLELCGDQFATTNKCLICGRSNTNELESVGCTETKVRQICSNELVDALV